MLEPPLLEVDRLKVSYRLGGLLGSRLVHAVNDVSFTLRAGETLGLVGESGCGKTSLARAVLGLTPISDGAVRLSGKDIEADGYGALRRQTAMIFQDPYSALNPRLTIGSAIAEVLQVHAGLARKASRKRVAELLLMVGLSPEHAVRKPATLSGGQCQRAGIARALALAPRLILADECVSALDVSIRAQIINLLIELRSRMGLAMIFIAHDLSVVRALCDRLAVMYLGRIVEEGYTADVFERPRHPYTQALLRSIPDLDPDRPLPHHVLAGEPPSAGNLPPGCPFHPRCPSVMESCRHGPPPLLRQVGPQRAACLLYDDMKD